MNYRPVPPAFLGSCSAWSEVMYCLSFQCDLVVVHVRERISRPAYPGRFPMVGRERGVIVWPVSCRWRASCGGAAGPTLARAGRAACCCPRCCPAGLPQGSPRDARSREVAKKSPAAHQAHPPFTAGGRGQVPAPGVRPPGGGGRHGITFIRCPARPGRNGHSPAAPGNFRQPNSRQPGPGSAAGTGSGQPEYGCKLAGHGKYSVRVKAARMTGAITSISAPGSPWKAAR